MLHLYIITLFYFYLLIIKICFVLIHVSFITYLNLAIVLLQKKISIAIGLLKTKKVYLSNKRKWNIPKSLKDFNTCFKMKEMSHVLLYFQKCYFSFIIIIQLLLYFDTANPLNEYVGIKEFSVMFGLYKLRLHGNLLTLFQRSR